MQSDGLFCTIISNLQKGSLSGSMLGLMLFT
jgi:hypothetical protein